MRRVAASVLILLACLLPALAVASSWAYGEATDTTRFMRTAGPLATDATVQREVAAALVAAAQPRLDAVAGAVPGGAAAVRTQLRTIASHLVASPAYREAWLAIQRTAHARLASRLSGDVRSPLVLDLGPVAAVLRAQVGSAGLPQVAAAIPDPAPVTIADREQVRRAHRAAEIVRLVRAVSIPGAVLALIGVVLTAGGLRRGLLRAAGCLAVAAVLLAAAWIGTRSALLAQGGSGDVAAAVYDVLSRPLRPWIAVGAGAAAALAVAGLALGPRRRTVP
ncbi:hypothetical protein FSW04_10525 [Baekduia soli]|uniref:Integral membrane protein n=1 Tax=Baekduia soli TaxID=496014 RepID=A0A5B8U4I6_9ACTN|nr:hypothetical protein [Baekduia soli]QEC47960.1 hypothetical protein FSW04_10525 [Baekduia soli]